MQTSILIQGGRIIDPAEGRDEKADLYIEDGRVANRPDPLPDSCRIVNASERVVSPGFWDIHVHLREPGNEDAETIRSGSEAAARGGFTRIVAMPNTTPALDTPERVAMVLEKGREAGFARVMTTACITRGRAGVELADLAALSDAGAVAFTDDGCTVQSEPLMREAMERARALDAVIMDHAQDQEMERRGVMHEGKFSRAFGLPGIPSEAEAKMIRRDVGLADQTGCRVHIQHMTSREAIDILAEAKARGIPVTGEVSPHHLLLCDADVDPDDASYKMNPPLRSADDRERLVEGVRSGIADIFATDHAPHTAAAKQQGFLQGPFGVLGLETAIGVTYSRTVPGGLLTLKEWIERWTVRPAAVLGLEPPSLRVGEPADVVVLDLNGAWTVDRECTASRSRNTPFHGRRLTGRAACTILGGRVNWRATE